MGIEIERKFLVRKDVWQQAEKGQGRLMRQGYLVTDPKKTIRVRHDERQGYLTIKGLSAGAARHEFEYPIPREEAEELLDLFAGSELSKTRYEVVYRGKTWEIDEFHGANEGLIVAEIELEDEAEAFEQPEWVGREVTEDFRYSNSCLSEQPFNCWPTD